MKCGFYLSPDGKHIVEIKKSTDSEYFLDVIGYDGEFEDFLFDICLSDFNLIFSAWERLK